MQVSRFGPPKTCRFPGLDSRKLPGLETWNLHVLVLGGSKSGNLHVLRAQTWKRQRFGGSKPGNLHVCGVQTWKRQRFGGSKPGNLHVLGEPACVPRNSRKFRSSELFFWPPTMQYRFKDLETSTKPLHSNRDRNVWALCTSPMMSLKGPKLDSRLNIRIETMIS